MKQPLYLATFIAVFSVLLVIIVRYSLRAHHAGRVSWQGLLDRLVAVNKENIALVALDLIEEGGERHIDDWPELSSEQIWTLVDGMDGLDRIEANCQIFIEIAMYIQRTHPEAVVVAEEFRRNARHVQWHLNRLRGSSRAGNLASSFGEYAQRAVVSYYVMSKQLLAICEQTDFAGLEQIRTAV